MEIEARSPDSTAAAAQGKAARGASSTAEGKDAASPFMALLAALQPAGEPVAEDVEVQEDTVEAVPLAAPVAAPAAPPDAADKAAPADPGMLARVPPEAGAQASPTALPSITDPAADALASAATAELEPTAARKPRPLAAALQVPAEAAHADQAGETRVLQRQQAQADLQAAAADLRSAAGATEQTVSGTAALAEAWSAAGRPQQAVRGADRHAERGAQPLSTVALGAAGGDVPVQGNGAAMAPTAASAAVPAGAQATATLAQKLSFWSARGVQNATLELEAFDGAKVDVRIAVQGREAKVEFRSDVPEARRWLQDALPQLEDMLQGEGLTLTGGFVGTSAGQDGRGGQTPPRDAGLAPIAVRNATVRVGVADVQALRTATSAGVARGMGQSVDLFV
jgi:flagellar hook-length control protein FliK